MRLDQISFLQKEAHEKSQINAVVTADILDLLIEIKGEIFWTNTINQPLLGQAAHSSWGIHQQNTQDHGTKACNNACIQSSFHLISFHSALAVLDDVKQVSEVEWRFSINSKTVYLNHLQR